MNRLLTTLRGGAAPLVPDRHLLDRFLGDGDEAAFAELVRRHGPVVWGACRRALANTQDAEDAFQATFLVLLRRAAKLDHDTPLGPWLYQVAVLTARNVVRTNRRRAAVDGPMEHEPPAPANPNAERLDLDAALLALSERERAAVVLCHLQGFTRREAAERLGCPEGTLSARLDRALARLRARLGAGVLVALTASGAALPTGLAHATTRSASIFTTSKLTVSGLSPTVAQLADGVFRMFWVKNALAVALVLVLGAAALALRLAGGTENVARATEAQGEGVPPAPTAGAPLIPKGDPQPDAKGEVLRAKTNSEANDAASYYQPIIEIGKQQKAAAELGADLAIVVTEGGRGFGWNKPPYTVREVTNGKVGEMQCYELDILERYLTRAAADPKGPNVIRFYVDTGWSHDQVHKLFAVCAKAGFKKGRFILPEAPLIASDIDPKTRQPRKVEYGAKEKDVDLTKYAGPQK